LTILSNSELGLGFRGAVKKTRRKQHKLYVSKTGDYNIKRGKNHTNQSMVGKQRLDAIVCHGIRFNLKMNEI